MKKIAFALLLALLLGAHEAWAQCDAGTRRVAFPRGRTTAVLKGRLTAGKDFCYRLRARAGQRMTVHLTSPRRGVLFSVFPPAYGAYAVAAELADWEGTLEEGGDYMISVTLPRGGGHVYAGGHHPLAGSGGRDLCGGPQFTPPGF